MRACAPARTSCWLGAPRPRPRRSARWRSSASRSTEGLSQSTVLGVFQDSRGFMWFGTEDGLNRYDGLLRASTYKYDPADHGVAARQHGVGDRRGPPGRPLDRHRGRRRRALGPSDRPLRARAAVGVGSPAPCAARADARLRARTARSGSASKDAGLAPLRARDGDGCTSYRHDPATPDSLSHDGVYALALDGPGHALGRHRRRPQPARRGDAARSAATSDDPAQSGQPGRRPRCARSCVDREGRSGWARYGGGLSRLEPGDRRRFRTYRHDPADPASLSHDRVRAILEDGAGRLWIGTDGGLDLLDRPAGRRSGTTGTTRRTRQPGRRQRDVALPGPRAACCGWAPATAGVHKWNPGDLVLRPPHAPGLRAPPA